MKNNLDPEFIKRQILLIQKLFSRGTPLSEEIIAAQITDTLASGIYPLVKYVLSLPYSPNIILGVKKLSEFSTNKGNASNWLNELAHATSNGHMIYSYTFKTKDIKEMGLNSFQLMETLQALKTTLSFLHIKITKSPNGGQITFSAMDDIMEQHNLMMTIGSIGND